jgi:hypothetical protein
MRTPVLLFVSALENIEFEIEANELDDEDEDMPVYEARKQRFNKQTPFSQGKKSPSTTVQIIKYKQLHDTPFAAFSFLFFSKTCILAVCSARIKDAF